jgi:tetratricopeptide (TPR) repeat protein
MSNPFAPPPSHLAKAIGEALRLHQRGELDGAEKAYRRILKTWPDQFDALHLCGMLQFQRGRLDEALKLLHRAIRIEPRAADVHSNLGMVLASLKRDAEALASFDRALALEPNNVGALINRGRALTEAGRAAEGLVSIDRALVLEPHHVEGRINRGNALARLGRHEEALADYDQVIALSPQHPGAHFNRGNVLFSQGQPGPALESFRRAASTNPKSETAWNACGLALQALGRDAEAVEHFERALSLNGQNADAHFNLSLALLTLGDYRRGFREYEWRWKRTGMAGPPQAHGAPWTGQPLEGRTILLEAEQGLGDTVMFARYVPLLAERGARVVLRVQPELKPLLEGMDGAAQVIARADSAPPHDFCCPLGSLPLAFGTELRSVPAPLSIAASADRLARWRARLGEPATARVALAWAGSARHVNDRNRSVPLAALLPLFGADAEFVSVQQDLRPHDAALLADLPRLRHLGPELEDFADTAAVLSLCDLVISVDTSVAHVAGALGRPLWLLIPFQPDWRWTLETRSPWYPRARLFRQPLLGDWAAAVAGLAAALGEGGAASAAEAQSPVFDKK